MGVINGLGPVRASGQSARGAVSGADASSFRVIEVACPAVAASAAMEVSLAGLLALQSESADDVQDHTARGRARDILKELDRLRLALLRGAIDSEQLQRLAGLACDLPVATDPQLRTLVNQIMVRAQVELARHSRI